MTIVVVEEVKRGGKLVRNLVTGKKQERGSSRKHASLSASRRGRHKYIRSQARRATTNYAIDGHVGLK